MQAGKKTKMQEVLESTPAWNAQFAAQYNASLLSNFRESTKQVGRMFVNAVLSRDDKQVHEMAEAIKLLKNFAPHGDRIRMRLLELRHLSETKFLKDGTERKWTIRELARLVEWPQTKSEDGFSRLRRLCHELNFPLVPIKTRKPKKTA
jgi:hypothetical protein